MEKIIKPVIIFLAILATVPFLSGAGVITPDFSFSAPFDLSKLIITLATYYFFVTLSLKSYDFLRKK